MRKILVLNFVIGEFHIFEYNEEYFKEWKKENPDGDLFEYVCMWHDLDLDERDVNWMDVRDYKPFYHEFYS